MGYISVYPSISIGTGGCLHLNGYGYAVVLLWMIRINKNELSLEYHFWIREKNLIILVGKQISCIFWALCHHILYLWYWIMQIDGARFQAIMIYRIFQLTDTRLQRISNITLNINHSISSIWARQLWMKVV